MQKDTKRKRRSRSTIELVKMISKSSGYYQYEVEDILNHLIAHIQISLYNNVPIRIDGIGKISRKDVKPRNFYSGITKQMTYVETAPTLSIKPDITMRSVLIEGKEKET